MQPVIAVHQQLLRNAALVALVPKQLPARWTPALMFTSLKYSSVIIWSFQVVSCSLRNSLRNSLAEVCLQNSLIGRQDDASKQASLSCYAVCKHNCTVPPSNFDYPIVGQR